MNTTLRHELPTHLNVEDKAYFGLSVRQVMYLTSGFSASYGLWTQNPDLPLAPRVGMSVGCAVLALALALLRPGERSLEEWAIVALRYLVIPKASTWRPGHREPMDRCPTGRDWLELGVRPHWAGEER